ncbi:MAG: hypothetical protein KGQ93_15040 [Cyanobacteria bacterium REEB459]|nr:hypothetical protein [Cyanobacteria bacterium REEB459]
MMRLVLIAGSGLVALGSMASAARAQLVSQSLPDSAWGFSRTVTCTNQTTTTTIEEKQFSNRSGFAIAGENVTVSTPGQAVSPAAAFVIVQPQQQFNLGIEQFTPGLDAVTVTNQTTSTHTSSRTFSVFQ